jgi:hypothetical protein
LLDATPQPPVLIMQPLEPCISLSAIAEAYSLPPY